MNEAPIKRSQQDWDMFFYRFAMDVAAMSKDPDRQVGAVLISADKRQMSFGFNGLPANIPDLPSILTSKTLKLKHMVHAEVNCLKQAPFSPRGCTLYVTRFPCSACAGKIRDAGVRRVVCPDADFSHARWGKSWALALAIMLGGKIQLTKLMTGATAWQEKCDCGNG